MKKLFTLSLTLVGLFLIIGLHTSLALAAPANLPPGFTATVLIDYNMIAPTGVKVAPDGRIFVFDLFGTIKIFTEGSGFNPVAFGSIPVNATGDRGLLGATFDTDFSNNPYIYIHYVGTDSKVHIGRFNASQNVGTNFTDIYVAPTASGFQHAGGGITMDNSGYIYFGIGDSGTPTNSQDLTTSHGKIHRIYRDGSIPSNNPFLDQPGVASTIYAYGVRNPFRLTYDGVTNAVYVGDVGFNIWEEVNLLQPGKNYGWALQEGPCTSVCSFENPQYWYQHQFGTSNTNDASIVLGPVYRGTLYPPAFYGKAFVSDYVQGFMRVITPTIATSTFSTISTGNGTVIDMDVAPNGKLYFVTINSPKLYRLDYASTIVNLPPVAVASATNTSGTAPVTISFSSVSSTDPEGAPLTYLWDFGDGSTSSLPNPSKTYTSDGQYTTRLTVSDGVNTTQSAPVDITVGVAPTLIITAPLDTLTYRANETITYAVSGINTNGQPLASSSITTTVRLHHSDHSHPFAGPFSGNSGQVTTPIDGELSPDVWLRFIFEAVGQNGVKATKFVDVYPQLSQITLTTNPAGLNVILDGSNHIIPPTVQGVVGMNRQIAAPSPQVFGGKQYVFDYWSDGGAQDHTFAFPATNTTYTAFYKEASITNQSANMVENGSFENNGQLPSNWRFSRWGNNNITLSVISDSRTGSSSVQMNATTISTGDGRIFHTPVVASSSAVHGVQYFYKTTVPFKAVADVTLEDNSHRYIWLGISQPSLIWREQNWTFTTPSSTKNVVVNMYHTATGTMQIDDFSLNNLTPPPLTRPVVNLTLGSNSVTLGATTSLSWAVTSSASSTCLASGGWSGTQPLNGSITITPNASATYSLSCANSAGTTTESVSISVTVPPPITLITNPSVELHDDNDQPVGFTPTRWGTNDGASEHEHGNAYDGDHSLLTTITNHTDGEAGWITEPIAVSPLTIYNFSEFAQSTGPTKVQAEITLANGAKKYIWLGRLKNATTWTEFSKKFTTPANAVTVKIGTYSTGIGSFVIDQITLTPEAALQPPTLSIIADNTTITPGGTSTIEWSSAGSNLICTASDGWSGLQPNSGSFTTTPTTTTTYTLTCSNPNGNTTKSITIRVNVPNNPSNPNNLIIPNTFFDDDVSGWIRGSYGTSNTNFGVVADGRTDANSLIIAVTDYEDGDAKWFFEPVTLTASTTYRYSHWYKSDSTTSIVVAYTLADSSKQYDWLGTLPNSSNWTQKEFLLTPPENAVTLTVQHVIKGTGYLQTDDYSLVPN